MSHDPQKVREALQAIQKGLETLFLELGPPPQTGTYEPTDKDLNDPFDLWGDAPSFRCYVARHLDCEPDGPEKGCTCSCGHQSPVCACSTREVGQDGELEHAQGCPADAVMSDAAKERVRKSIAKGLEKTDLLNPDIRRRLIEKWMDRPISEDLDPIE